MSVEASADSRASGSDLAAIDGASGWTAPAGLDWLSRLPSRAAPGFVYLAGSCRGVAVGGGGRSLAEAGARLAGEAAEVAAQLALPAPTDLPGDPAIDAIWTAAACPLGVAAVALATGERLSVPAAAIFLGGRAEAERAATAPPASLGLAAGPTPQAARTAALFELVERDAAAAWWCEGAPAHALDAGAAAAAGAELARLREGAPEPRATSFLALPGRAGIPVVCAASRGADGRGLAVGLKAAASAEAAAMGAMLELLQMELALELARHRAERGAAPGDAGPLARAALDPDTLAAFAIRLPRPLPPVDGAFASLALRLLGDGVALTVADMPGAPGAPAVAKVLAPALRPLPGVAGGAAPLL